MLTPAFQKLFVTKEIIQNLCRNGQKLQAIPIRFKSAKSNPCGVDCHDTKANLLQMDLACKVALVIGGTSGIGFHTASRLLHDGAKAVAITGLDTPLGKDAVHKLNNIYGQKKAMFINANNNCIVQLEETCKVVKKKYKHIDILVNAAGILDGCHWEQEIVTNLVGAIRATLLAYRHIGREATPTPGRGGVCLHIAGVYGLEPLPPAPTLAACMHGIVGMSRSFGDASHFDRSGVRVLCLCPGVTNSHFWAKAETKGMTPVIGRELDQWLTKTKKQRAEVVGQGAVQVIKCGLNGSVWVCDDAKLYRLDLHTWKEHATLTNQYI